MKWAHFGEQMSETNDIGIRKSPFAVVWRLGNFLGSLALTFLGLTAVTFIIGRFITVDPVLAVVGDRATQEVYEAARISMGLDRSVPEQYFLYLKKLLSGDLGHSVATLAEPAAVFDQHIPS